MKPFVILHVFTDDKFFDNVSDFFDSLDNVSNLYYFYAPNKNFSFKYIKQISKIRIFQDYGEYVRTFANSEICAIYFQGLHPHHYKYFKYISSDKLVFWWCFGFEIYSPFAFRTNIVKCNLYKVLTRKYMKRHFYGFDNLVLQLYQFIRYPYFFLYRNKVLRRIDYFTPVLPIEYDYLRKYFTSFKAKPFMLEAGPGTFQVKSFSYNEKVGNVLVGNSLTYTNNHVDIFFYLKKCVLEKRQKLIVPVNYGKAYRGRCKNLKQAIGEVPFPVIWLENFLPFDEYVKLLSSITHAIFGVIRQQAMGTIFKCLLTGVKVFLFKDSIIYQYLMSKGYFVYAIEEICCNSLVEPLSRDEALHNFILATDRRKNCRLNAEMELAIIQKECN